MRPGCLSSVSLMRGAIMVIDGYREEREHRAFNKSVDPPGPANKPKKVAVPPTESAQESEEPKANFKVTADFYVKAKDAGGAVDLVHGLILKKALGPGISITALPIEESGMTEPTERPQPEVDIFDAQGAKVGCDCTLTRLGDGRTLLRWCSECLEPTKAESAEPVAWLVRSCRYKGSDFGEWGPWRPYSEPAKPDRDARYKFENIPLFTAQPTAQAWRDRLIGMRDQMQKASVQLSDVVEWRNLALHWADGITRLLPAPPEKP